jgi:hypothetical protein
MSQPEKAPSERRDAVDEDQQPGAGSLEPESNLRLMWRWTLGVIAAGVVVYAVWVAIAWVIDAQP